MCTQGLTDPCDSLPYFHTTDMKVSAVFVSIVAFAVTQGWASTNASDLGCMLELGLGFLKDIYQDMRKFQPASSGALS